MISTEKIKAFKLHYSKGLFVDKDQALAELSEIISEVEQVKEHFEIIVEEFDQRQPNDDSPYYSINMPRWSRDRARETLNDLKALERKIKISEL